MTRRVRSAIAPIAVPATLQSELGTCRSVTAVLAVHGGVQPYGGGDLIARRVVSAVPLVAIG